MSSEKYGAPMVLAPRRSRRLALLLLVALLGAAALPFMVSIPTAVRLPLLGAVALAGYHAFQRHFGRKRIAQAVWDAHDRWHLRFADGEPEAEVQLEGDSFITPELMVLNFRTSGRRRSLVVFADTLDGETRRRLRVRLHMEARRRRATRVKEKAEARPEKMG